MILVALPNPGSKESVNPDPNTEKTRKNRLKQSKTYTSDRPTDSGNKFT